MEERVVTIEFDATVAGRKLDVCGANIVLGINDIPRIELMIPPTKSKNSTPMKPNVSRPSLSDFSTTYKNLAKRAESQNDVGSIDITVTTNGTKSGKKVEKLSLKDWVLSGVGLSSVSATQAPHLSVILHHPAFWLTKVGSIYETPRSNQLQRVSEAAANGKTFMGVVRNVYQAYRPGGTVEFFDSPNSKLAEVYRGQLGVGKFDPENYIVENYSGGNLFLATHELEKASGRICSAIGKMVCPMGDGSSTWDMIVGSSGTLLLNLVQNESNNFTKKAGLSLEPMKPWRTDNVVTLPDDRCFWTDVPGMDMFKIAGVMARKMRIFAGRLVTWANTVGSRPEDESGICDVLYCPVDPEKADGRIMKTSTPRVLEQAFMEDGVYGENIVVGFAETKDARLTGFDDALLRYCRAVYEITYGSMNTAKAQMALGFKDVDGKWILPGTTCRFVSDGKEIYYGYIRNVVHSLSTKGGCSTNVGMAYIRPEAAPSDGKVPDGNANAAYDL